MQQCIEFNQVMLMPKQFGLEKLEKFVAQNVELFAAKMSNVRHREQFLADFEQFGRGIEIVKQMKMKTTSQRDADHGHFVGFLGLCGSGYEEKCQKYCET